MSDYSMYKVWIEINKRAASNNFKTIRSLLRPKTKLWAVVKSNAYGHGLILFSKLADKLGADGFCVDSVVEGLKLRENGIKKPILVLGPTLPPNSLEDAYKAKITLTISNYEALKRLLASKYRPEFHLKIDTGMHRQGLYLSDTKTAAKLITNYQLPITGIYTHFAAPDNASFTSRQFAEFEKALEMVKTAGFGNVLRHAASTGGTLVSKNYHLDAVRIGIGLCGLYPSEKLKRQLGAKIKLEPVLSWCSVISEVKHIEKGDAIGYDLIERILQPSQMAVVPIGYWHGFDRGLSKQGEVLICGKRAKVLGRVSMDLIAVDITGINCKIGDMVTLIGKDGREEIGADELAQKIGTVNYEVITRINPLIERLLV